MRVVLSKTTEDYISINTFGSYWPISLIESYTLGCKNFLYIACKDQAVCNA